VRARERFKSTKPANRPTASDGQRRRSVGRPRGKHRGSSRLAPGLGAAQATWPARPSKTDCTARSGVPRVRSRRRNLGASVCPVGGPLDRASPRLQSEVRSMMSCPYRSAHPSPLRRGEGFAVPSLIPPFWKTPEHESGVLIALPIVSRGSYRARSPADSELALGEPGGAARFLIPRQRRNGSSRRRSPQSTYRSGPAGESK